MGTSFPQRMSHALLAQIAQGNQRVAIFLFGPLLTANSAAR